MEHYTLFLGETPPSFPPKKTCLGSEAHIGLFVQNFTLMLYNLINLPNLMGARSSCGQCISKSEPGCWKSSSSELFDSI
jgi:hypothetical protein